MDSSSKLPVERPSNPVHSITIGSPDGLFSPAGLSENVSKGDVIEFTVVAGTHSIVRADPQAPCTPIERYQPMGGRGVTVGKPAHKFGRPLIEKAAIGDAEIFEFFSPKHSVVRADGGNPCIPYETYHSGKGGFFSGMKVVGIKDPNQSTLDGQIASINANTIMVQPGDEIPPEAPSASPPPQAHGRTVFSTGAIIVPAVKVAHPSKCTM
ncbi:hypothetical protein GRF29_44g1713020 [Pseudopithomyces chartarum]|uniref:Uncharacterized protein n=1 Tax=Pseudopithomyces chartarum TaxID=1892770 RepID=A0AAN6M2N6_9PLEO|nr:hypothetical protein GRF29_44g1713020 [Pseudopithomyces chartarum]